MPHHPFNLRLFTPMKPLIRLLAAGVVMGLAACHNNTPPSCAASPDTPASAPFTVAEYCAARPLPKVLWLHVHENETTALAAARQALARQAAGCVRTLHHGNGRDVAWRLNGQMLTFDPNRMFSAAGRTATLRRSACRHAEAEQALDAVAADFVARHVHGRRLLVAVHNNQPHGISVYSFMGNGILARDAAQVAHNPAHSHNDFFYVTGTRAFDFFARRGFNVVLQDNARVRDDGSLSVYAARHGIDYINVEAAHGHLAQQQAMLAAVYEYIRIEGLDQ